VAAVPATASTGYQCGTSTGAITISGGETYEIVFDPLTFTTTTFRAGFMSVFTGALPSNAAYLSITSAGTIGV